MKNKFMGLTDDFVSSISCEAPSTKKRISSVPQCGFFEIPRNEGFHDIHDGFICFGLEETGVLFPFPFPFFPFFLFHMSCFILRYKVQTLAFVYTWCMTWVDSSVFPRFLVSGFVLPALRPGVFSHRWSRWFGSGWFGSGWTRVSFVLRAHTYIPLPRLYICEKRLRCVCKVVGSLNLVYRYLHLFPELKRKKGIERTTRSFSVSYLLTQVVFVLIQRNIITNASNPLLSGGESTPSHYPGYSATPSSCARAQQPRHSLRVSSHPSKA